MSGFRHQGRVVAGFIDAFGAPPVLLARAPGRVNLIGEHTDYNDGWVLPAAIPYEVNIAAAPRPDSRVHIVALDLDRDSRSSRGAGRGSGLGSEVTFDLNGRTPSAELWQRYPQGVAVALQQMGHCLRGMNAVFTGDVPRGGGLSSSAAVEVAFATAFAAVAGLSLPGETLALAGFRAENDFVGVPSGVMDQFISALGQEGHALLLDCRKLAYRQVPVNLPDTAIVIMDSGVRRELAGSEYGVRRATCDAAVASLRTRLPAIHALRDMSFAELEANRDLLSEVEWRRAAHVVAENARTLEAAAALEAGDAQRLGALMRASHVSLRDLYEVSSLELDALVEIACGTDGVIGARMTGAGFGGAAVALVERQAVPRLEAALAVEYPRRTGRQASAMICTAAAGASVRGYDSSGVDSRSKR